MWWSFSWQHTFLKWLFFCKWDYMESLFFKWFVVILSAFIQKIHSVEQNKIEIDILPAKLHFPNCFVSFVVLFWIFKGVFFVVKNRHTSTYNKIIKKDNVYQYSWEIWSFHCSIRVTSSLAGYGNIELVQQKYLHMLIKGSYGAP